jgi:uncharacterized membrane protein YwzB
MKTAKIFLISAILLANFLLIFPNLVLAAAPNLGGAITGQLEILRPGSGYGAYVSPTVIVGNIIFAILTVVGIVFLILIFYAGFRWMTSGGNEETIKKAKTTLTRAIIGLIIILASYSISWFVVDYITWSTTP